MTPADIKRRQIRTQVVAAVKAAYPEVLPVEVAVKAAFQSHVPTPQEALDWCVEYQRLLTDRFEEARAWAKEAMERMEAEDD